MKKYHIPNIELTLAQYADRRTLDFHQYSPYHMRISDGGYTVIDIWTTGRYYVLTTDYLTMLSERIIERGGEKGQLHEDDINDWLDELFFPESQEELC